MVLESLKLEPGRNVILVPEDESGGILKSSHDGNIDLVLENGPMENRNGRGANLI